jgi:hypothetical protein
MHLTNRHDVPANAGSWTLSHRRAPGARNPLAFGLYRLPSSQTCNKTFLKDVFRAKDAQIPCAHAKQDLRADPAAARPQTEFLEIVPVGRRSTAERDVHVDQAVTPACIVAR